MPSIEKFDDPIWEYTLNAKLVPYIPAVRKFWENISDINIRSTGVFTIEESDDSPHGLMYRVTNTPVRSPIKNIQVFPFVPTAYLNLTNVSGGAHRMVSKVCSGGKFTIDEFTIIEKSNLPSTYNQGQFVAFVPTEMLNSTSLLGKWVYLTADEMVSLCKGAVTQKIKEKLIKYI